MNFQSEVQISLTVLITGLVVVFLMLIFLTLVIKGYGSAVQLLLSKYRKTSTKDTLPISKAEPVKAELPKEEPDSAAVLTQEESLPQAISADDGGIPQEVLAVIAAAAYSVMPGGKITSVRRAVGTGRDRSAWGMAGLLENTRPF